MECRGWKIKRRMKLGSILRQENIVPELAATDRWQAIEELVDQLIHTGAIAAADRPSVLAALNRREQSMSTGIGYGVGIPHAPSPLITEVAVAFGRSRGGVEFAAVDDQPVTLVVLFLAPQGKVLPHLPTLAGIARLLHRAELRHALEQAPDADAMLRVIRDGEKETHAGRKSG